MRPPLPSMMLSRRTKILLSVVALVIVLLIVLVNLSGVYINYLWFGSVGHRNVYSTMFWTRFVLFVVFGLLMAVIIGGNLVAAYLIRPPFRPMSPEQQNLQNYVLMIEPRRKLVLAAVMVIAFLAAGASAQGDWAQWQLFLHGDSFGVKDPQFGMDVSFYAFDYPVYRTLLGFGFTAVIFSIILTIGVHYLSGAIRLQTPGPKMTIAARRHLTVLVFVFMALKAVAYWLDRYGLVFSDRSKFTGASYTDIHSLLPAKTILFWITIILALGVLASMWLRSALLPGIGFVVLLVLSILISGIYPAIIQQVTVKPNASDKEAPYILRNIDATRQAYNIVTDDGKNGGTVVYPSSTYPATAQPDPSLLAGSDPTVTNLRILDPAILSPTFLNAQQIARPYGFSSKLDVDRYTINNVTHDYIVGVRELVKGANLTGSQDNWINQHTVYTHGFGFVAAAADSDITNAQNQTAAYTEGNIPQKGPLDVSQPRVYFGQDMNDYSIVGAKGKKREFDSNNNSSNFTYTGKGGVSLSSPITKLAFAIDYKETSFLLNDAVSADGAKIIFDRDPKARLEKVAPFLTVDGDPYPFVDTSTGHIMWMLDGYTTMANFPYSQRESLSDLTGTSLRQDQKNTQINYIRNSVKATVDAYDGTVTLYQWDNKDPILKAWMNVFPGLVKPGNMGSQMPLAVREHVRYPQDLFNVQRSLLAQYHIDNPVDSYNGKGTWAVPSDPFASTQIDQPAYYVLANSPTGTSTTPQFQLTTPMVVSGGGRNLTAYLSVNSDPGPDYGKITVLRLPGTSAIKTPAQIANLFKSEPNISKDINLLDSSQTNVLHGNLLTLPLGGSFLYVEPLYVQASQGAGSYPTLQRVLVQYGNSTGYGQTLALALSDIIKGVAAGSTIQAGQTTVTPPATGGSSTSPSSSAPPSSSSSGSPGTSSGASGTSTPPAGSQAQLFAQLNQAYAALNNAYASRDQVKIAEAQQKVNDLVQQLLQNQSSSANSPKPAGSSTAGR